MQRRKLLLTTGAGIATILAGCSGDDNGNGEAEADEEEPEADENGGGEEEDDSDEADEEEQDEDGDEEGDDDDEEEVDPDEVLEDEDQESTREGLEILEHELVEDTLGAKVEGVVANNTGEELDYVEVGVVLYNEEDQRIDDWFTNTTDLPDGEEWAFEVTFTTDLDEIGDYTIAVTDSAF